MFELEIEKKTQTTKPTLNSTQIWPKRSDQPSSLLPLGTVSSRRGPNHPGLPRTARNRSDPLSSLPCGPQQHAPEPTPPPARVRPTLAPHRAGPASHAPLRSARRPSLSHCAPGPFCRRCSPPTTPHTLADAATPHGRFFPSLSPFSPLVSSARSSELPAPRPTALWATRALQAHRPVCVVPA